MKIVFIHQNFPGQFKHLAPALAAEGHTVIGVGSNKPQWPTPGVRVILHRPRPPASQENTQAQLSDLEAKVSRARSVAQVLARLKKDGFEPDLIYAHSGWGEALFIKEVFPAVPLLIYAEYYYGTPGGDSHFDPEFSRESLDGAMRVKLKNTHLLHGLMDAEHAISPTRFQKERHPDVLQKKISVIHDGIDTTVFRPNPESFVTLKRAGLTLRASDEVVTFVARELEPYRGYHIFMRALPDILASRPQAQVVIVGGDGVSYGAAPPKGTSWKEHFLRPVAAKLDMQRVHFVGKVPHEVLTQLMQISTAHVYLTYPFVLSWSLLEAMSVGCLVIGSRTGPLEEVIKDGKSGLLVDFFDPQALARTVSDALARRQDLQPLRAAARQHVVRHFDLKSHCLPEQLKKIESMTRGKA